MNQFKLLVSGTILSLSICGILSSGILIILQRDFENELDKGMAVIVLLAMLIGSIGWFGACFTQAIKLAADRDKVGVKDQTKERNLEG